MERKWSTRMYQPGDEQGILELWRLVFSEGEQERGTLAYWNWQFRDNPAGLASIRIAADREKIVGQYAVIPMRLQIQGRPVTATLSLDTMTHPDYRRQGMFETLATELYAELDKAGVPIIYGFPNDNSLGGFVKKLQWTHICSLPVYVRPLRPGIIVQQVVSNPALAAVAKPIAELAGAIAFRPGALPETIQRKICWLERFDERVDVLWAKMYDPRKIAVTRSAEFLNWRYLGSPTRGYRALAFEEKGDLVACAILRCMEQFGLHGGMITDLLSQPGREDALQAILEAAIAYFAAQEMDLAVCLSYGDNRVTALLKRNRFLLPPKQFAYKEWHFGGRVGNGEIAAAVISDSANWYLTFGDTDII